MISPIGGVSATAMLRGPHQDHDRVAPPVVATDPAVAAAVESAAYWSIVLPSPQGEGPDAVPLDRRAGEMAVGRVRGLVAELRNVQATLAEAQQTGADCTRLQGTLETSLGRVRDLAGAVAVDGGTAASSPGAASSRAQKKLLLSPAVGSGSGSGSGSGTTSPQDGLQYFQIFRISELVAAGIADLSAIYSLADRISDNATYDRRTRPLKVVAGFSDTVDLASGDARLTIMTEPLGGIDLTALDVSPGAREDVAAYAGAVEGTARALDAMAGTADGAF